MRLGLSVFAVLLVTSLIAATAAGSGGRASCAARGSVTLAASSAARVYSLPKLTRDGRPRNGEGNIQGRTYGCFYSGDHRVLLGARGDRVIGGFRLSGHFLAYVASSVNYRGGYTVVEVVHLPTGRKLVRDAQADTDITDIALAPSGSAAWIRNTAESSYLQKYEEGDGVSVVDPGFSTGLAIGRRSRSAEPGASATLYWTSPTGPRSAPLK